MTNELAVRIREVPDRVAASVADAGDEALRARPAAGEWSAIEVCGHLIDKVEIWRVRVERACVEDTPVLEPYDQDELVRAADYQVAELDTLLASLRTATDRFASTVERLDIDDFVLPCVHADYGQITLRECITLPLDSVEKHLEQIANALRRSDI